MGATENFRAAAIAGLSAFMLAFWLTVSVMRLQAFSQRMRAFQIFARPYCTVWEACRTMSAIAARQRNNDAARYTAQISRKKGGVIVPDEADGSTVLQGLALDISPPVRSTS
jgi:hypothetical protein